MSEFVSRIIESGFYGVFIVAPVAVVVAAAIILTVHWLIPMPKGEKE